MFYRFETFGPYSIKRINGHVAADDLRAFWSSLQEQEKGLAEAIGVYIIAAKTRGSNAKPWYVGKTDRGFRKRIDQHWKLFATLADRAPIGDLQLYFLARVTSSKGSFRKPGKDDLPSVGRLETMLIGSCLTLNEEVINQKKKGFYKELLVPGYFGDEGTARSPAAKSLSSLLDDV